MSISLSVINSSSVYDTKQTLFNPAYRASLADRYPRQPKTRDLRHGINLLDLYAGCSTPGQVRTVFKRTLREDLTKGPGLSYNQASDLTSILSANSTFSLSGVSGFWDNETTARNMSFVALDKLPEFQDIREIYLFLCEARDSGIPLSHEDRVALNVAIGKMKMKMQEEILGKDGGGAEFLRSNGFSGLVTNKRTFLDKRSLGSILRAFLPGIIDENNPLAFVPHEVEQEWWDDRDYAKRQVLKALHSVPGLSPHLETYEKLVLIKQSRDFTRREQTEFTVALDNVSDILRKEVLNKGGGGEFLYSNKLGGLVGNKRTFLDKKNSLGAVLRAFLPGIIDENNPHALKPHEVEHECWDDRDYAKRQVLRALHSVPGLSPHLEVYEKLSGTKQSRLLIKNEQVELDNAIRGISDILRKEVLDKGVAKELLYFNGLEGLVTHKRTFLDKLGSLGAVLRAFLPEVSQRLME
jgi:hypothetical protein